MSSVDTLQALSEAGVSIWLDDLSRQRVNSGNLADLIRNRHVVGLLVTPTTCLSRISSARLPETSRSRDSRSSASRTGERLTA